MIFDQYEKLWLLEINLNPACEATRSQKLQNIADKMIHGMMKIVKGASGKSVILGKEREKLGWDLIYGKEKFRQVELEDV